MSIILAQVGWAAHKLEGGYKSYRRDVLDKLETLPATLSYRVVCGATGSGKSRLLAALTASGAQVLDLEGLAQHRGSVLGGLPEQPQPSQKWFDTLLVQALQGFDPARPVFVEAESNKIGRITLPAQLLDAMHGSACVLLDTALPARVALLMEDYRHFLTDTGTLIKQLQVLLPFHGHERLEHWNALIRAQEFDALVSELLELHYDPSYLRALGKHYPQLDQAQRIALNDVSMEALLPVARELQQASQ